MTHFAVTTSLRTFTIEAADIFTAINTAAILILDHETITSVVAEKILVTYMIVEG
jgi:hypothetical protein